jgi:manganese/iron transport system ATP-binding protein
MNTEKLVLPTLCVDQISVTYRNGHHAIHDTSFSLKGGTICGLVGVNGSGKSTLFKCIIGLVKPDHGRVTIMDKSVDDALKKNLSCLCSANGRGGLEFPCFSFRCCHDGSLWQNELAAYSK